MGIQLLENGVKLAGLGPEPPFRPVTRSFDHATDTMMGTVD